MVRPLQCSTQRPWFRPSNAASGGLLFSMLFQQRSMNRVRRKTSVAIALEGRNEGHKASIEGADARPKTMPSLGSNIVQRHTRLRIASTNETAEATSSRDTHTAWHRKHGRTYPYKIPWAVPPPSPILPRVVLLPIFRYAPLSGWPYFALDPSCD